MFGRLIMYAGGVPVGFTGKDPHQVTRAYELLKPRLRPCLIEPERALLLNTAFSASFKVRNNCCCKQRTQFT